MINLNILDEIIVLPNISGADKRQDAIKLLAKAFQKQLRKS
jgi:hypothetical protein